MIPLIATFTLVYVIFAATLAVGVGACAFYYIGRR